MTYQAIAFDLDGTLLNPHATILESSKQAIKKAREKGIKVFFVTGRHHTARSPVLCGNRVRYAGSVL